MQDRRNSQNFIVLPICLFAFLRVMKVFLWKTKLPKLYSLAYMSQFQSTFTIFHAIVYSEIRCSVASKIAILRCNVAILMCKLLGPNCIRFEKSLSKSYNVLKIYLQFFLPKMCTNFGKNSKCNLIF